MPKKPVAILIDGNHLVHRNFWSLAAFTTKNGRHSGAFFGSVRTLRSLITKFSPQIVITVFDGKPKKQLSILKSYKQQRRDKENSFVKRHLYSQLADVKKAFGCLGTFVVRHSGKEADPTVAVLAHYFSTQDYRVFIVSSDSDYYQCLTDDISMYDAIQDRIVTPTAVLKKLGLQNLGEVLLHKAIMGDRSDNIPAVKKGMGKIRTTNLLTDASALKVFKKEYEKEIAFNLSLVRLPVSGGKIPTWIREKLVAQQPMRLRRGKLGKLFHKYETVSILQDVDKWLSPFMKISVIHKRSHHITGEGLERTAGD